MAAALAVNADIPVQDVPYDKLRKKLDALEQKLERVQEPINSQQKSDQSVRWQSQEEWNSQKKGWEWLFPYIDTNSDGTISVEEYKIFQQFKAKHNEWEKSLGEKASGIQPVTYKAASPILF